jgi:hypothetical protein
MGFPRDVDMSFLSGKSLNSPLLFLKTFYFGNETISKSNFLIKFPTWAPKIDIEKSRFIKKWDKKGLSRKSGGERKWLTISGANCS